MQAMPAGFELVVMAQSLLAPPSSQGAAPLGAQQREALLGVIRSTLREDGYVIDAEPLSGLLATLAQALQRDHDAGGSEEAALLGWQCVARAAALQVPRPELALPAARLLVGHVISLALDYASPAAGVGNRGLRCAALAALHALLAAVDGADALAPFLPGVASGLAKVVATDSKHGHAVACAALLGLGDLVCLTLADERNAGSLRAVTLEELAAGTTGGAAAAGASAAAAGERPAVPTVERSAAWLEDTAGRLALVLRAAVERAMLHPDWRVRDAAVATCRRVALACRRSLGGSLDLLIDGAVSGASDSVAAVRQSSAEAIRELSPLVASHATFSLPRRVAALLLALQREIREGDGALCLRLLGGYLALGCHLDEPLNSEKVVAALLPALASERRVEVSPPLRGAVASAPAVAHLLRPQPAYVHIRSQGALEALAQLCERLPSGCDDGLAAALMKRAAQEGPHQDAALLLMLQAGSGWAAADSALPELLLVVADSADTVTRSLACDVLAMLVVHAPDEAAELSPARLRALYPLLEACATPGCFGAASRALQALATASGAASTQELLGCNLDWVADEVCARMRRLAENLTVGAVVEAVGTFTGGRLVQMALLRETLKHLFDELFSLDGGAGDSAESVLSFVKVCRSVSWSLVLPDVGGGDQTAAQPAAAAKSFGGGVVSAEELLNSYFATLAPLEPAAGDERATQQEPEGAEGVDADVKLVVELLAKCEYLLAVDSVAVRLLALDVVQHCLQFLGQRQQLDRTAYLPTVADVWPTLRRRATAFGGHEDELQAVQALAVMCTLFDVCGSFIARRMEDEVLPAVCALLQATDPAKLAKNDLTAGETRLLGAALSFLTAAVSAEAACKPATVAATGKAIRPFLASAAFPAAPALFERLLDADFDSVFLLDPLRAAQT